MAEGSIRPARCQDCGTPAVAWAYAAEENRVIFAYCAEHLTHHVALESGRVTTYTIPASGSLARTQTYDRHAGEGLEEWPAEQE